LFRQNKDSVVKGYWIQPIKGVRSLVCAKPSGVPMLS